MISKKTIIFALCLVLVAAPAYGFVAAWVQRVIIIAQQITQIGNQVEQIKSFQAKLDKIREQVDLVKDLKNSAMDGLNALKGEFSNLVSRPVDLVGDTMNWGGQYTGEARRTFDAARDFGRNARSLRDGWRNRLNAADQVTEADILALFDTLPPGPADKAKEAWRQKRASSDTALIMDHTVSDAAAALTQTLKDSQASIAKLRNQTNKSATALAQAQVTGLATQGEVLTAVAQLQAWQAARETAKHYQQELERRRRESDTLALKQENALKFRELQSHWDHFGRVWQQRSRRDALHGPAWLRSAQNGQSQ